MSLFLIKYNPVIIHSEINLLGFSIKFFIPFWLNSTTPYLSGSLTIYG